MELNNEAASLNEVQKPLENGIQAHPLAQEGQPGSNAAATVAYAPNQGAAVDSSA